MKKVDVNPARRTWDTDKAIRGTYRGLFGKYQLRAFIVICIVYSSTESWISSLVQLNAIPPVSLECVNTTTGTQVDAIKALIKVDPDIGDDILVPDTNDTDSFSAALANQTVIEAALEDSDFSHGGVLTPLQLYKDFNVSANESKSVLTEFGLVCGEEYKVIYARIGSILAKHTGSFLCGIVADKVGRKFPLMIASLVSIVMILFQILSEDFVSYCFFMLFVGLSTGSVVPVAISYVMETSSRRCRGLYTLILLMCPCIADLVIPWIAYGLKSWKILQVIAAIPAIIAILLYWWTEETAYYFVSLKKYIEAIESLTRIAAFNGSSFSERFREAEDFKRMKMTKGVQCDFQPLLRLRDIDMISSKYPDVNFAEFMEARQQSSKTRMVSKILRLIGGTHYNASITEFYIFDYIYSPVVAVYFVIFCAMWFVNGLTCSSLESHELSWRMKKNPYTAFCYSALMSIVAGLLVMFPVYRFSRRWTAFCAYLIVEVCLLASIVAKIEMEFTPITVTLIYLVGKMATVAVYFLTCIMCAEIFPTGLRCTSLGIGLLLRGIGLIIADPELLNFHDWTSRLVYGFLSLVIGSLALVLPETRRYLLPRSFKQIQDMRSTVSKKFRRRKSGILSRSVPPDASGGIGAFGANKPDQDSGVGGNFEEMSSLVNRGIIGYTIDEEDDEDISSQRSQSINDTVGSDPEDECDPNAPVHEPTPMVDVMQYRAEHDDAYFSENL